MADEALSLPNEIWKAIAGWEGFYEVSSLGRVKSLPRVVTFDGRWGPSQRRIEGRIMALNPSTNYPSVMLRDSGRAMQVMVHRLVCEAFHGRASKSMQVSHINGVRTDARASNLRWATPKENNADKLAHGTQYFGDRHNRTKLPDAIVASLRGRPDDIEYAREIAERFGMNANYIRNIQRGVFR